MTAAVNCWVLAKPPKSLVLVCPSCRTLWTAPSIFAASASRPKCSSSLTELSSIAVGLALFLPTAESKVCLAPGSNTARSVEQLGLAPNSILFCWLFTVRNQDKKCASYKHTFKVCRVVFWQCPRSSKISETHLTVSMYMYLKFRKKRLRSPLKGVTKIPR